MDFGQMDIPMGTVGALRIRLPGIDADGAIIVRPRQRQPRVVGLV